MKLFRQTTVLFFLFIGFSGLNAQNSFEAGKIVTNEGDTLVGFINIKSGSKLNKECQFKLQMNSQVINYTPESIKGFIIGNDSRKFVRGSLLNTSSEVFLEVLCEGNLNLYYLDDNAVKYYIQKKGESTSHSLPYELTERYVDNGYTKRFKVVETTYHIDTLKRIMKDKPSLFPDIEKIQRPDKKNLTEIVTEYNSNSLISESQNDRKTIVAENQLVILRHGKMNLYVQTDSVSEQHFYIQKGNGTGLIELPFKKIKDINYKGLLIHSYTNQSTNHIDTLKKYMADAMPLYASIEEVRTPTKSNLEKLMHEYNSYTDENTYIQKHTLKRLPLNVDVVPGFNFVFASLVTPVVRFGSFVDIGFINSNKHVFFKSGLFVYTGFTPLTERYYSPSSAEYQYNFYPPATTCLIPLQFEYRFSEKKIQPILSVGYNLYLFNEIKPYNVSVLPVVSPGMNIQMGKRFSIRLNLEFEFNNKTLIAYIPETFKKTALFFGLQIKL